MELHLDLRAAAGRTLRARAEYALREAIRDGRLAPGARLPATRALASELGVSRGVIADAHSQLAAEGYLRARRGAGTTVAPAVPSAVASRAPRADTREPSGRPRHDLRPTLPALDGFPRAAWLASTGRVIRSVADERLDYPTMHGEPELRAALAAWLARTRGTMADPSQVVVTGSMQHGLPLVWRLLLERGVRRVGVEEPGWGRIRETLEAGGLEAVPVAVDEHGLNADTLARLDLGAVSVTPAHQFPTGTVLDPGRRAAVVAWARERGAFVLEDDYDGQFRYDRQPIGSLQGFAPDLVIYGGSASKTLAPALRIGWLILPPVLTIALRPEHGTLRGTPPTIDQLILADLIERGDVDRHLRRQRQRYRRRRNALLEALAAALPEAQVRGAAAGLFVVLLLPTSYHETVVASAVADLGVRVETLGAQKQAALIVGYANLPEAAAADAVATLAAAVRAASQEQPSGDFEHSADSDAT